MRKRLMKRRGRAQQPTLLIYRCACVSRRTVPARIYTPDLDLDLSHTLARRFSTAVVMGRRRAANSCLKLYDIRYVFIYSIIIKLGLQFSIKGIGCCSLPQNAALNINPWLYIAILLLQCILNYVTVWDTKAFSFCA